MKRLLITILMMFLMVAPFLAQQQKTVTTNWTTNTEPDLAGYRLYWGRASRVYDSSVNAGLVTSYAIKLSSGTWFLALTAYDTSGNESGFSNETTVNIDATPPGPPTGAVSSFALNATEGVIVADGWGTNPGTATNGPIWTTGKYGNGLSLDGVNDYVSVADSVSLDLAGTGTIEAWVRLDTLNRWHGVIAKGTANSDPAHNYALEVDNANRVLCILGNGSSANKLVGPTIQAGAFRHVACAWDGSSLLQYIDGFQSASMSQTLTPTANSAPLFIGQFGGNADRLDGIVDEVRIYSKALSPEEIVLDMENAL